MPIKTVEHPFELENEFAHNKNTIVMFSASWCEPCRIIKPVFERFSNYTKYENIGFVHVDIDDADQISIDYKITSVPTFIMFVDGVVYERLNGANTATLEKLLDDRLV